MNLVIKVIWERNSRHVNRKLCVPKNIVHIAANISPKDVKFDGANESKIKFIASGSKPLKHENKLHLAKVMEESATNLRHYLPVVAAMAIQCSLPSITDEELSNYKGILRVEDDEREGNKLALNIRFRLVRMDDWTN